MAEKKAKAKPKAKKKAPAKAKALPSTPAKAIEVPPTPKATTSTDRTATFSQKRCASCGHGVSKVRGDTPIVECHRYPQNPIQGYPAMDPKNDWCGEWTVEAPAE